MEDEKKDLRTDIHIHSHRAFVQLSRMERMPMTDGEWELWIVCKELQAALTSLLDLIRG
jgi:hypothetical protein